MPFYTDRPYPSAGPSILISEIKSNFDQVIIHSGLFQNPSLPLMAGKYNNLSPAGFGKPCQRRAQPVVIIEYEAVVKDERHPVFPALDKLGGSQPQRQINLVGRAAADLLQWNQLFLCIQECIQVFINADAGINAAGDAADQLRGWPNQSPRYPDAAVHSQ